MYAARVNGRSNYDSLKGGVKTPGFPVFEWSVKWLYL